MVGNNVIPKRNGDSYGRNVKEQTRCVGLGIDTGSVKQKGSANRPKGVRWEIIESDTKSGREVLRESS